MCGTGTRVGAGASNEQLEVKLIGISSAAWMMEMSHLLTHLLSEALRPQMNISGALYPSSSSQKGEVVP